MLAVMVILAIGIGLLGAGFYYNLYDNILTDFFSAYIIDTNDVYYIGSQFIIDALPWVLMLLGVLCFILAGLTYRSGYGVSE